MVQDAFLRGGHPEGEQCGRAFQQAWSFQSPPVVAGYVYRAAGGRGSCSPGTLGRALKKVPVFGKTNKKAAIERQFLEAGNELLHDFDDCPYCRSSNLTLEELKLNVENRLKELNKLSRVNKEVVESYKKILDELSDVFQNFKKTYNFIETDRSEINSILSLKQVLQKEGQLYNVLAPIVSNNELFISIKELSEKTLPTNNDFKNFPTQDSINRT